MAWGKQRKESRAKKPKSIKNTASRLGSGIFRSLLLFEEELVVECDPDSVEDGQDPELAEQRDDERHDEVDRRVLFEEGRPSYKKVHDPADERKDEQNDLNDLALLMEPSVKVHNSYLLLETLLLFYTFTTEMSIALRKILTKNFF